jgi:SSS family transporter
MRGMQITIIFLYFLMCIAIGYAFRKRGIDSESGYLVAGRMIGPIVGGLSMAASYMSAAAFMGIAGMGYKFGLPFIFTAVAMCGIGFVVAQVLIATPLARRASDFTITDYLTERYESQLIRVLTPIIVVILLATYGIPQLMASGMAVSKIVGMSFPWAVVLSAVIFVLYVSLGGMWAVSITDAVQAAIMLVAMVFLGCWTFFVIGDTGEILKAAFENNKILGGFGLPKISYLGAGFLWFFGVVGLPHLVMRIFTARGERVARQTLLNSVIYFNIFYYLGVFLVAIVGSAKFPGLVKPDQCVLRVMELVHPIMQGLLTAGLIAAVMSTTDTLLITISAAISNDLYYRLISPDASQRRVVMVGKISVWVLGAIIAYLATQNIQMILIIVGAVIGTAASTFAMPLILGIYWKDAKKLAGELGVIFGFVVCFGLYLLKLVPPMSEAVFGVIVSALVMVVVTYVTKTKAAQ